jgi:uncharacterized protein (TIGR02284 family)
MDSDRDIDVLNSLIETTIDSVDGYEKAAEVAGDDLLSGMFRQFASDRRQAVTQLRSQVVKLGGEPEDDGSVLASAHRAFLDVRSALEENRTAAIAEVERGEDFIRSRYEDALDDDELSPDVRDTITGCYETVLLGHNAAADLKRAIGASGQM